MKRLLFAALTIYLHLSNFSFGFINQERLHSRKFNTIYGQGGLSSSYTFNDSIPSTTKEDQRTNTNTDDISSKNVSRGQGLTIAIVGAGVGGLSIASRIASSPETPPNTKVIILEKNSADMIGGRCGSFFRDVPGIGRFRFERGPSLLLLKDVYLNLFKDCGVDVNSKDFDLQIEQCAPAYQVVFDDGDAIQLGFPGNIEFANSQKLNRDQIKDLEKVSRDKMNEYEINGAVKWDQYMQSTAAFLECGLPNFIQEKLDLKSFPAFINEATREGFKVCLQEMKSKE